jgi:hypothetical protein
MGPTRAGIISWTNSSFALYCQASLELTNKRHKVIGSHRYTRDRREQDEFHDIARYGRYLRAKTYSLGSSLEARHFFMAIKQRRSRRQVPVNPPVDKTKLREEFNSIRQSYELFSSKNYNVIFAPTRVIPKIFQETGRLREITFRAVGEGTNRATDIDEYDFYYHHLIVWDNDTDSVVGAYRLGKGREILSQYGVKGFYINSLFRMDKSFEPYLSESLGWEDHSLYRNIKGRHCHFFFCGRAALYLHLC